MANDYVSIDAKAVKAYQYSVADPSNIEGLACVASYGYATKFAPDGPGWVVKHDARYTALEDGDWIIVYETTETRDIQTWDTQLDAVAADTENYTYYNVAIMNNTLFEYLFIAA